jgi:hypothetical protein
MPTRKQRRRDAKSKRHEYEFVYVDGEGNEVDDVPEEPAQPKEQRNGTKPAAASAKKSPPPARGRREPQPPSWSRALKRSVFLGAAILVLFSFSAKGNIVAVIVPSLLFTLLYIPMMYYMDRFVYRRWQAKQQGGGTTPAKKR